MKKEKAIGIIKNARESHDVWIKHGRTLIDGVNLDSASAPLNCDDCEFDLWFNSNGTRLRNFSWYQEVNQQHENFHKSYSVLYYESMRMYNPKTRTELIERFDDLELQSNLYNKLLDDIYSELNEMMDADFERTLVSEAVINENVEAEEKAKEKANTNVAASKGIKEISGENKQKKDIAEDKYTEAKEQEKGKQKQEKGKQEEERLKENEIEKDKIATQELEEIKAVLDSPINFDSEVEIPSKDSIEHIAKGTVLDIQPEKPEEPVKSNAKSSTQDGISSNDFNPYQQRQLLKQQDLKQIEQEKELTQLELNQYKERHKLTQQSIKQLEQYYLLKHQEIELDQRKHAELETKKLEAKSLKEKELALLDDQTQRKIQELDQLEMVNQKLARKKEASDIFEKQQITQLDEQSLRKLNAIKQIEKHLELRKIDLTKLEQQVVLVEQEIANLESQKNDKDNDLKKIVEQKNTKIEQHDLEVIRQKDLDEHKAEVQKEKENELGLLEQQQQLRKDELHAVKQELIELGQTKIDIDVVKQRELRELEEQQALKQEVLMGIENKQQAKRQEIRELELKQESVEQKLKEMEQQVAC